MDLHPFLKPHHSRTYKVFFTLIVIGFTSSIQYFIRDIMDPVPYMLYFPAVLLCCLYGHALLSIILTTVLMPLFMDPYMTYRIIHKRDLLWISIYLISTLLIHIMVKKLVTSQAETSKALKRLQEERSAREAFVSTLTHDLQTPLTAIKMATELIGKNLESPVNIEKNTERIMKGITRAQNMIRDLLDSNRLKINEKIPLKIKQFELMGYIESVVNELNLLHQNRIKLTGTNQVSCYGSEDAIRRILENLCSNAIKYGDKNSQIEVTITTDEMVAKLEVHNEGRAIPEEDQEYLFNLYHRSKSASNSNIQGWGLGLSLVRGLAEALGGKAEIKSAEGFGTSFFVHFPLDCRDYVQEQV